MSQRKVLLLSSSSVYGYKYLEHPRQHIDNLLKKNDVKTVLFIPYALKEYDNYTAKVSEPFTEWGYTIEGIHTKNNPIEAVNSAQAIFIGGGNTFVLLKTLYDNNLVNAIRERVLQHGIPYIGISAGTNVATRSIHTTNDMPVVYPPTFQGLNLVPFNINPHFIGSEQVPKDNQHMGETRTQRIHEFISYHGLPVLGLREGTGVSVEGDKATLLGDRNATLLKINPLEVNFYRNQLEVDYAPGSDLSFLLEKSSL